MLRMLLILIFIDWNKYLKKKRTEKDIVKLQATSISLFLINQLLQTTIQLNNHSAKQTNNQTNKQTHRPGEPKVASIRPTHGAGRGLWRVHHGVHRRC